MTAGGLVRAPSIRDLIGVIGVCTADIATQSNDIVADIPGLTMFLEPDADYALDGYIAYDSGATPAVKLTFSAPPGAAGHWTLYSVTAGPTGNIEGLRRDSFDNGGLSEAGAGGSASFSGAMTCQVHGYLVTGAYGGPLQWKFAQATSNASTTTVKAGSWIRAMRMDT